MQVSDAQMARLRRSYDEIGSVLREMGVLDPLGEAPSPADPQWLRDIGKQWRLLRALAEEHDGDVGADEWSRLGREHGYDPRGLGGFFAGSRPLMGRQGERRVLTTHGRRFIERWRPDMTSI